MKYPGWNWQERKCGSIYRVNLVISTLSLEGITKTFSSTSGVVKANQNVSFQAEKGEIHAILGENGAGKTTLMRVLAGLYQPDAGSIKINDQRVQFRTPRDARKHGIGMVHQHFSLIPDLTVADNLALSDLDAPFLIRPKSLKKNLLDISTKVGLPIRPDAFVRDLSMGERQRVEVFRLIMGGAGVLILDEPTSILAPAEADILFGHLRRFADDGCIIILITHKIPHVRAIADHVTIMRAGKVAAAGTINDFDDQKLSEAMVGSHTQNPAVGKRAETALKTPVLEAVDVSVEPSFSPYGINNASFSLHGGEILGIAGISGNGQDELVAAIVDNARLTTGKITRRSQEFAYIPADRIGTGIAPTLSVKDNLCLRIYQDPEFTWGPFWRPFLKSREMLRFANEKISAYAIMPDNSGIPAGKLSGGNIQKLILAREMHAFPPVVVAVNPTTGLDVANVSAVHNKFRDFVSSPEREPSAILLVSEDLDELLELCDRILVIFAGKIAGEFLVRGNMTPGIRTEIGMMMSGIVRGEEKMKVQADI